jgi:hypothetical protein
MFTQRRKHLIIISLKRLDPSGGNRGHEDERPLIFIFACLRQSLKAASLVGGPPSSNADRALAARAGPSGRLLLQ